MPLQHDAFDVHGVPGAEHASHDPLEHEPLQHSAAVPQPAPPARQVSHVLSSWQCPEQQSPSPLHDVPPEAQHLAPCGSASRLHSSPAQHGTSGIIWLTSGGAYVCMQRFALFVVQQLSSGRHSSPSRQLYGAVQPVGTQTFDCGG